MAFARFDDEPEPKPSPGCPIRRWLTQPITLRPGSLIRRTPLVAAGLFTLAGVKCIVLYVALPATVAAFAFGSDDSTELTNVEQMPLRCPVTGHDASSIFAPTHPPELSAPPAADAGVEGEDPPAAR